jgi:uncharacterized membrane protein YccF (DUF307 family)
MVLAGCWFALGHYEVGAASVVLGLVIPGLIFTFS